MIDPDQSTNPLHQAITDCADCKLRQGCNAPVPGFGNWRHPAAVLVGEAPGQREDEDGVPFVGQAGEMLDGLLKAIGLSRMAVFITNVVKCRPKNNADPTPTEIASCSKWLRRELELTNPRVVVAMGRIALHELVGEGNVEQWHGRPVYRDGTIILPTYHPAAGLHDMSIIKHLYDDFRVLGGLLSGKSPEEYQVQDEYPNPQYFAIDDPEAAEHAMLDDDRYALDTESVGNDLWSVQLSWDPGRAVSIPAGLALLECPPTTEVLVHHYLHDSKFVSMPNFLDSMVMAYLLGLPQGLKELASRLCGMEMQSYSELVRPYRRGKAISYLEQAVAMDWPDPPILENWKWDTKAGKVVEKQKKPQHISRKIKKRLASAIDNTEYDAYEAWYDIDERERAMVEAVLGMMPDANLEDVPVDKAIYYGARDADATMRVSLVLQRMISEQGLDFVLRCVDQPTLPMAASMMNWGMVLDSEWLNNLTTEYRSRMNELAARLADMAGRSFNPKSSQQVARLVYEEMGFKVTRFTKTRLPSTDDEELKKIDHPIIAPIIEYRRLEKQVSTYSDKLPRVVAVDGRIHTTIKTTRTSTGRWSSSEPNLQNIPVQERDGVDGNAIRSGFVASPGYRLLAADYAQIEMRVCAHLSQCQHLIQLYLDDRDIHTEMAAEIFGISLDHAGEFRYRYPMKRANFGVIYGISGRGLYDQFIIEHIEGWDVKACEQLLRDWFKLNPEVRDFHMATIARARRTGYVSDVFGRIRYVPEVLCPIRKIRETGEREAINMPVQSSAQGIIKLAMSKLWDSRPSEQELRFLMQIHDEILTECREDKVEGVTAWAVPIMEGVVRLSVPVTVNVKLGQRWGELEEVTQ